MLEPQIVIGIPGYWKSMTELKETISAKSNGYLLNEDKLRHLKTGFTFKVEVFEHDPRMKMAFMNAGLGRFNEMYLQKIDKHTSTVYLVCKEVGLEAVKEVIDAGVGLLLAGGLGVKIETSGLAYAPEEWTNLANNKEPFPMYVHFVSMIKDEESFNTNGMSAFGLPDAVTPKRTGDQVAVQILTNFNMFNLNERPPFQTGQFFGFEEEGTRFRLNHTIEFRYKEDHIFYNSFGIWGLHPPAAQDENQTIEEDDVE